MTRPKNLLIEIVRFFRGNKKTVESRLPIELRTDLYNEIIHELAEELYREQQVSKTLKNARAKLTQGKRLSDKEALEIGIIQL